MQQWAATSALPAGVRNERSWRVVWSVAKSIWLDSWFHTTCEMSRQVAHTTRGLRLEVRGIRWGRREEGGGRKESGEGLRGQETGGGAGRRVGEGCGRGRSC